MHKYNYKLQDIEDMMPWEREIYVSMLIEHEKRENEKLKILQQNRRNM